MESRAKKVFSARSDRFYAFIAVAIFLSAICGLSACTVRESPEPLVADQVNIFYGGGNWAMFGADGAAVAKLTDMYNQLELQKTEKEVDFTTSFDITFYKDEQPVGYWTVDEHGICRLGGADATYKILFDSFDYGAIRDIYEGSKDSPDYQDGIYIGAGSDTVDTLINNIFDNDWPRGMLALIGQMSDTQKKAFTAAPVKDGTVEKIARQVVSKWIAGYAYDSEPITFIDAEISEAILVATYDEDSDTPLYLYEPHFRLLPDDPDKIIPAGSLSIDDKGWLVDGNAARHRMLLTTNKDGSYHYIGCPAFDAPVNYAIREIVINEPEEFEDFTFISADFMFTLGRQFGDYPWSDYGTDIPTLEEITQSDMPGMVFYRAAFGPRISDGEGETVLVYYTVEESGYTYLSNMLTTDPAVTTGRLSGDIHRAKVGMSEKQLLAAYSDQLIVNNNMVFGNDNFCPYDQVYEYVPMSFYGQRIIRFYLNEGSVSGIEMFMILH